MKKHYFVKGLRTLSKYGSLIFCENCERVIGSINEQGYRYINLNLTCKCGVFCSLEMAKKLNTSDADDVQDRMPSSKDGIMVCKRCGMPMFGIIDDRIKSYSFFIECDCGEKYDLIPTFPVRLGETLKTIKKHRKV